MCIKKVKTGLNLPFRVSRKMGPVDNLRACSHWLASPWYNMVCGCLRRPAMRVIIDNLFNHSIGLDTLTRVSFSAVLLPNTRNERISLDAFVSTPVHVGSIVE